MDDKVKAAIFWKNDSNDLSRLILDELQGDSRIEFLNTSGNGEEVSTSDMEWLKEVSEQYNCVVEKS